MLPMTSADGAVLTSISRSSSNVAFTTQTIKGVSYAVFDSPSGTYTATYTPDTTPPVISSVSATATPTGDATITWTTNEASNSSVAYGTNPKSLASSGSDPALTTSHSLTVHGLAPGTTYSFRVTSVDRAGNSSTSPPAASPASITVPTFVTTDTTAADFSAGTAGACAVVAHAGDGEVELGSTVAAEFSGTQVPSGWDVTPWDTGGTVTVGGGVAAVNGARLGTTATYNAGRSLEFVATFASESFQHVGFGVDYNAAPWAMFSTGADGTTLKARTNDGSNSTDTVLSAGLLGSPHQFRIDWSNSQVVYSVDGTQVATHAAAFSTSMRPLASDLHPDANQLSLDSLQLSPHVSTCSFVSRAIDGGAHRAWVNLDPVVARPAGTSIQFNTRTSNDAATWSAWSPVTGNQINSPTGRYLQYQAVLTTTDVALTPSLTLVRLASNGAPATPTGVVGVPGNGSAVVSWTAPANNGSAITAYVVTPYIGFIAQPARTFNSAATSQTITGLTNGTAYLFKVAARNANGTGPQSAAPPAVTVGAPVAPTGVTAVPGDASAVLSWTAPSDNGFSISAYVVTPYVGSTAQMARTLSSTATTQTITGLTNATTYTFTVAAKNAKGTGPPSAATAAITAGAPVAPTNVVAVPGNGSAALSWTAPANNGSSISGYVVTPYIGLIVPAGDGRSTRRPRRRRSPG